MVKVGIVGLGTMGRQHAEAYRQMPDVQLCAVYDHHLDRARRSPKSSTRW
jgi:predicted dehydrogenase